MTDLRTFLAPSAADLFLRDVELRAEDPDAASAIGMVLHVTGAVPELPDLQEYVAGRLSRLPCMAHILHGDGRRARWVRADPDPAHHVSARRVGSGPDAIEAAVRDLVRDPWPDAVPAWRLVLLHGHVPDGFALLYLTHHAVQDGATIVAILETLFGPDAPTEQPSTVLRTLPAEPRPRLRQVLRSAAVLLRHARKHHVWTSPSQPLSSRRHTSWVQVPVVRLKAVARASGASINDVYLAALGHALAEWASTSWPRAAQAPLPVMVPVSLRTADEWAVPGNRLFLTRVDLPGGLPPLAQRLARTSAVTAALKLPGHRAVLRAALTRLPAGLLRRLVTVSTAPGRLTLAASCLVMRKRLRYGDAVVNRIDPVMCCPPGAPLAVAMLVYAGEASVCFRIDEALPGAESLPARWRQALEELSAAGERPPTGRPGAAAAAAAAPGPELSTQ
ncbi:wax ester/triacylglycerol synthase domain-containing protein [Streptomyces europaeiscabiei]|uniref:wax ester/triacylglycerol synthase domain-containing protein n=1 Tax=Streptomyces europaeiscabiei TaxID=146819 RepID=UPI0038F5DBD6